MYKIVENSFFRPINFDILKTPKANAKMHKATNKILIIGPSWVGDTIMAQCLFKLIKQTNPNMQIDVLAQNFLHPLLACPARKLHFPHF